MTVPVDSVEPDLLRLLSSKTGHFSFAPGIHGDLWLDLDSLFVEPRRLTSFAGQLAERIKPYHVQAICGPATGGAYLAVMVSQILNLPCFWTDRIVRETETGYKLNQYELPAALRSRVTGLRVDIVDDAINAGSAVRSTMEELERFGAHAVLVGALLKLGTLFDQFSRQCGIPVEQLYRLQSRQWKPGDCPLCRAGVPLDDPHTSVGNGRDYRSHESGYLAANFRVTKSR